MQPEKYFTDQSMYCYSAYRRPAKMAGCPAAEPCQHHTVPKRVGKTTLEQRRPRLERPLCAAIERRFQTQTDTLAEARGIPRALIRTTTGHETAPFDRYGIPFGNKGPMRTREGPTVRIRLPPAKSLQTISSAAAEPITADHRRTAGTGVRREKAALSSGCKAHPATRSSRKQSS